MKKRLLLTTVNAQGYLVRFKDKEVVYLLGGFSEKGLVGKKDVVAGKFWP